MKKIVYSLVLVGVIVVSGLLGFANQDSTSEKQTDLGSAVLSLNILNK
ncbi:hypothetical protein SAMN05421663_10868 [Terribacillus halophilus]|uniref:Phr family secreted Rap phosphatase inhibitor n=1 Tax=Terribacillus halophilus TaxID=361279 RepID=A0A1G6T6I5_9BACI|nr:hypothetical protein [Terribacillus halophilus]SDD24710.1 hypothetical protein SAMN05421663_10868 [Terribacillus halophilus]